MKQDGVLWEGTPLAAHSVLVWLAITGIALGVFALLYWYAAAIGKCVEWLIETDCTRPRRSGLEVLFIACAVVAGLSLLIATKIAVGFPQDRYTVTANEVRVSSGWPLRGQKAQPLAHVSIERIGNSLRFTGIGARPVLIGPLSSAQADQLYEIVKNIRALS